MEHGNLLGKHDCGSTWFEYMAQGVRMRTESRIEYRDRELFYMLNLFDPLVNPPTIYSNIRLSQVHWFLPLED